MYSTYNVEAIFEQNSDSTHKIGLHIPDDYDRHSVSNVKIFDIDVTNTVHYNAGYFFLFSEWYFEIEGFFR